MAIQHGAASPRSNPRWVEYGDAMTSTKPGKHSDQESDRQVGVEGLELEFTIAYGYATAKYVVDLHEPHMANRIAVGVK